MIINDYRGLIKLSSDTESFEVWGLDFDKRSINIYPATRVTLADNVLKLRTQRSFAFCSEFQRFLTTDFKYSFDIVPASLLSWIRLQELTTGRIIGGSSLAYKARTSIYESNPHIGRLLLWDAVIGIYKSDIAQAYSVRVQGSQSFILNDIVYKAYE